MSKEAVIVRFVQMNWFLGKSDISKERLKIQCPFANVIVLFKQITIPSLNDKQIVCSGCGDVIEKSVIE